MMPVRYIRVDEPTWNRAKARATLEGTTPSAVARAALARYGSYEDSVELSLEQVIQRLNTLTKRTR